jgi:hypothetical protein
VIDDPYDGENDLNNGPVYTKSFINSIGVTAIDEGAD